MREIFPASIALVALTALAGCNDPAPVREEPSVDAIPTSTPTVSRETAADFIRRWQSAANTMQQTGETTDFASLSLNCASCETFISNVERIYEAGGYIETDGGVVLQIQRWGQVNGWPTFDALVRSPPSRFRESANGKEGRFEGGRRTLRVSLERLSDGWVVRRYSQVAR